MCIVSLAFSSVAVGSIAPGAAHASYSVATTAEATTEVRSWGTRSALLVLRFDEPVSGPTLLRVNRTSAAIRPPVARVAFGVPGRPTVPAWGTSTFMLYDISKLALGKTAIALSLTASATTLGVTKDTQRVLVTRKRVPQEVTPPPPPPPPAGTTFAAPLRITAGGTYSGNWSSDDPDVPAVTIATSQPVTLRDCRLRGRGHLVRTIVDHAKVTITNCHGLGLNPGVAGLTPGRFLHASNFDHAEVTDSAMTQTAGIYLLDWRGSAGAGHTVRVLRNRARNIDGRHSTGSGYSTTAFTRVQFLQLDKVRTVPGMQVAWNEVVNEPFQSRVEDVINIYLSSGTSSSPMTISNNFIRGAYPAAATTADFSGGGILLGDGDTSDPAAAAAWVRATGNVVLDTTNYGIAAASGHDLSFSGNRIVSDGRIAGGQAVGAQNIGMYLWNMHESTSWARNGASSNVVGWVRGSARNDWWLPDCATGACTGNSSLSGTPTAAVEDAEEAAWTERRTAAGISGGPDFAW